jgi:hypothetical protein
MRRVTVKSLGAGSVRRDEQAQSYNKGRADMSDIEHLLLSTCTVVEHLQEKPV